MLIGPKKYEKPQYVANVASDIQEDSPELGGKDDNDD